MIPMIGRRIRLAIGRNKPPGNIMAGTFPEMRFFAIFRP
jgi:hypothetical protein